MSLRFQRFAIIVVSFLLISIGLFLILSNTKNNLIFFYTPSELKNSKLKVDDNVRIGGIVKKNSFNTKKNNLIFFIITDKKNEVSIEYNGILPDLFKEEQGVVVQGKLKTKNHLIANQVYAKHDENYMPASIKEQLQKNNYWKNKY